jgi:hypothetical protein
MQRKPTQQSPAAKAAAKAHMAWIKQRGICAACGDDSGVICHHSVGSSFKIHVGPERVQIGNEFVLGLCLCCDTLRTRGGRKPFTEAFGLECDIWARQYQCSPVKFEQNIIDGIAKSGR